MKRWALLMMVAFVPVAMATPSGKRWALAACGTCPSGQQCVSNRCAPVFKIATTIQNTGGTILNGTQKVPYQTVVSRMGEAFKNWTSPRVTACNTSWTSVFGGNFSSPAGTAAVNAKDLANNVIWLGGAYWRYSATTLAYTTVTSVIATGEIVDADMELNNNINWSDTAAANTYDYESVVLHEAGHFLGLDHTAQNAQAVMFATVATGTTKRALAAADTGDLCTVYPGDMGGQGLTCTTGSQCTNGRVCEGSSDGSSKICTADCTGPADDTCPTGYSCQASSAGFACLTQLGTTDLCSFCTSGSDCNTGVCVTDRTSLWCSLSCSNSAQCGTGYSCDASGYCVPKTSCSAQCTSAGAGDGCAVGFTCLSGTCRPSGNDGDRCEVLGVCNACLACVSDASGASLAFCRPCCGGAANDGFCKSCTNTSCVANTACTGLANGKDQVCVPSSGNTVCAACDTNSPCQKGLTCKGGRCHSDCNPFAPGNCTGCFDTGNGTGLCSCDDEVAHVGEPCGQTATSLNACDNGLLCVSSPTPYCRVPCTPTDTTACRLGETCTTINGTPVCIPSAVGNQCTACTAASACNNSQYSCYANRCYLTCNINTSGRCSACVQTDANGNGLCACDDQIVGSGADCALPAIAACQPGTLCVESICRPQCDPSAATSTCPAGSECQASSGSNYCLPPKATGGGTGGGGGTVGGGQGGGGFTGIKDAGTGGGTVTNPTLCGCTSFTQVPLLGGLFLLAFLRRRAYRRT